MGVSHPHLASLIFNEPLAILPEKLEVILSVLGPRIGLSAGAPKAQLGLEDFARQDRDERPQDGVLVVPIRGTMTRRSLGLEALSGLASHEALVAELDRAAKDPAIRGVVLDIDSPGGEVAGLLDAVAAVRRLRAEKPVFAVANEAAHSAAFVIASAADRVFSARTGGVGGVGIVVVHVDQSRLDAAMGLTYTLLHAGARKVDGNAHQPLSQEARETIQARINDLHGLLVAAVAEGRGMTEADVRATEARSFFGESAVSSGFADQVGGLEDAVAAMRERVDSNQQASPFGGRRPFPARRAG